MVHSYCMVDKGMRDSDRLGLELVDGLFDMVCA